ncbi:hypothetical protein EVAR_63459_1 [Eumeta japonica]|uniref:Uncharacterized protein n=1 Tax=Eumeta variegata TaxID=151549 RepID=A0A4C1YAA5_EUMVA|nr:hypothetical protein EVAR_63459_1 [Eumeta japonica]
MQSGVGAEIKSRTAIGSTTVVSISRGKRECEPTESHQSSPPMNTRHPKRVTSALSAFWKGIGHVTEGSEPSQLSLTGRNETVKATTSRLHSAKCLNDGAGSFPCRSKIGHSTNLPH